VKFRAARADNLGMLDAFLALVFPERCPACDALVRDLGLCASCAQALYPTEPACPRCALPGQAVVLCARCRLGPPPFERVHAPYRYGGELANAICRWKWGARGGAGRPELARPLGQLLAPTLAALAPEVDVLVPVPLHRGRLAERGFSQAVLLAASARRLGRVPVTLEPALLERTRATAVQTGLGRRARLGNVAGAFRAPRPERVRGRRVALIDDVVTTGATAAACARALRQAGAAAVHVVALARAEG
jgi:ComF family protein